VRAEIEGKNFALIWAPKIGIFWPMTHVTEVGSDFRSRVSSALRSTQNFYSEFKCHLSGKNCTLMRGPIRRFIRVIILCMCEVYNNNNTNRPNSWTIFIILSCIAKLYTRVHPRHIILSESPSTRRPVKLRDYL